VIEQQTGGMVVGLGRNARHSLSLPYRRLTPSGVDVDGVLRGKIMAKDKFLSVVRHDGFGFCSVIYGWDSESSCSADSGRYSPQSTIRTTRKSCSSRIAPTGGET
jgi:hypothetical protein